MPEAAFVKKAVIDAHRSKHESIASGWLHRCARPILPQASPVWKVWNLPDCLLRARESVRRANGLVVINSRIVAPGENRVSVRWGGDPSRSKNSCAQTSPALLGARASCYAFLRPILPPAYNPAVWSNFFAAQIGASAALAGLIFVAVSINLSQIVGNPLLVSRCAKAISVLIGVLLAATLAIAPEQPLTAVGCELTALGAALWVAATRANHLSSHRNPYVGRSQKIAHLVLTQCATLPILVCGVSIVVQRGGGFYWLLAGVVFSLATAMVDAWVLLIEIQR